MGKKSSSQANPVNTDRRVAVQGGIGISGDGNALGLTSNTTTSNSYTSNYSTGDFGAIAGGTATALRALDFAGASSKDAMGAVERVAGSAIDGMRGTERDAFNLADRTTGRAFDAIGNSTGRALDSVDRSTALVGSGYDRLIDAADRLFARGESMIGQTQQAAQDAYRSANTDAKGSIDNKTIIVLAVAGAVAVGAIAHAGKKG